MVSLQWMGELLGLKSPCECISLGHAHRGPKITQVSSQKEFQELAFSNVFRSLQERPTEGMVCEEG